MTASTQPNPGARSWSDGSYRPRPPAGSGRAAGISRHERTGRPDRHRTFRLGLKQPRSSRARHVYMTRIALVTTVLLVLACLAFAAVQN